MISPTDKETAHRIDIFRAIVSRDLDEIKNTLKKSSFSDLNFRYTFEQSNPHYHLNNMDALGVAIELYSQKDFDKGVVSAQKMLGIIEYLLFSKQITLDQVYTPNNWSPASLAVKGDKVEVLKLLKTAGAELGHLTCHVRSHEAPVHLACRMLHFKCLDFLLQNGQTLELRTLPHLLCGYQTALSLATDGPKALFDFIIDHKITTYKDRCVLVRKLLMNNRLQDEDFMHRLHKIGEFGVDLNEAMSLGNDNRQAGFEKSSNSSIALYIINKNQTANYKEVVDWLIDNGAKIQMAMDDVIKHGKYEPALYLLKKGAQLNDNHRKLLEDSLTDIEKLFNLYLNDIKVEHIHQLLNYEKKYLLNTLQENINPVNTKRVRM